MAAQSTRVKRPNNHDTMELFQLPISESPRRLWLKKHRISTHKSDYLPDDEEPWNAWAGELSDAVEDGSHGTGSSEDDALCTLAKKLGLGLWNEVFPDGHHVEKQTHHGN